MTALRPTALVHRGSVLASAFVLEPALLGEHEARARVLAWWQPGAALHVLPDQRWLLRLFRPVRVDCAVALGAVLVRDVTGALFAAPLRAGERTALAPSADDVVLVVAGVARVQSLAACGALDPATWIALDDFELVAAEPLIAPQRGAPAPVLPAEPRAVREVLGGAVPAPAAELEDALADLERRSGQGAGALAARGAREPLLARIKAAWSALRSALRSRPSRRATSSAGTHGSSRAGSATSSPSAGLRVRSPWTALADWLNAWMAELLHWSRISRVLGAMQARYLHDMLEMFERGDLHEALRHAIPLSEGAAQALRQAFTPPRPRASLTITHGTQGARSSLQVGNDLFALMRDKYRTAARQLEAQGKIEQAAFVWAELLRDAEAAVALLERHGMLRKAAELAEARELAPGLVVRQWFLARDVERALLIARRHGAFADAIARLERSYGQAAAAEGLRLLYGDALASAGDYAGAVDVLWHVPAARPLAVTLLRRAYDAGGAQTGRSLARMLAAGVESSAQLLARVQQLSGAPGTEAAATRLAFATALIAQRPPWPLLRAGARAALRSLLGDSARGDVALEKKLRDGLLELADDAPLRADLPLLADRPAPAPLAQRDPPIVRSIAAADRGNMTVEAAVLLPNGGLLVALGDAGMRIYRPDLRSFRALGEPAHDLVVSRDGTRAIAIARRGRLRKLARVDLLAARAESWCEAELDRWTSEFDGSRWFVIAGGALAAIDATADSWRALWRVGGMSVFARSTTSDIVLDTDHLRLWVEDEGVDMVWAYELSSLKLRQRIPLGSSVPSGSLLVRSRLRPGAVGVVQLTIDPQDRQEVLVLRAPDLVLPLAPMRVGAVALCDLAVRGDWAAVVHRSEVASVLQLVNLVERRVVLRLQLERAIIVRLRLTSDHVLVADDLGRVRVHSLRDGRVLRDLRVTV